MDRREFHKLVAAAMFGASSMNPVLGQEMVTGPEIPPEVDSFDVQSKPREALAIGTKKQLFVDRFIVDRADEVLFTLIPPEKYPGNPVLIADAPSDGQIVIPNLVRWDEQKKLFQLWYYSIHLETGKEQHFPAYAESDDGLHWRRPELGILDFNGSRANNLVGGRAQMMIYDAHDANPNRRYKSIDTTGAGPNVGIWFSADGFHWTPCEKNPVLTESGDTHTLVGWDERHKKYIGYFRPVSHPEMFVHGQRRQIGISFSDDAENWTPIVPIIAADMHDPWGTEFYWLHATCYEDVYLGVLSVLHLDADLLDLRQTDAAGQEQTVDMQLVCSRDGVRWSRMGNRAPWLSLGPYQSWDDQVVWPSVPILAGDEIRLYYGGTSLRHNVDDIKAGVGKKFEGRTRSGGIGMATLRRDGWVAVEPNLRKKGVLTTQRFILEGSELELNVDAEKGRIIVELLGEDGSPLPGFSGADGINVSANAVRHRVKWRHPLAERSGQVVRLRFALENSKLYAFQFLT